VPEPRLTPGGVSLIWINPSSPGCGEERDASKHAIYRLTAGTGIPGILTLTAPGWLHVAKNKVFQSSPPKARLVAAEAPCTIRMKAPYWRFGRRRSRKAM